MPRLSLPRRTLLLGAQTAVLFLLASPAAAAYVELAARDGHGHNHHAEPLRELNETEVTMYHAPIPESYFTIDFDGVDPDNKHYPALMILHGLLMSLAFFVALPIGIALRSVKHAWHGVAVFAFYALSVLGCAASALYTKLTPNMYEGQVHSKQSYAILLYALALTVIDIWSILARIVSFVRSRERFALKTFWYNVILGRDDTYLRGGSTGVPAADAEYAHLVSEEPEEIMLETKPASSPAKQVHYDLEDEVEPNGTAEWANDVQRHHHHHQRSFSHGSEATLVRTRSHSDDNLHEMDAARAAPKKPLLKRIASDAFKWAERGLVMAGFSQVLLGIIIYTGGCRENYINGCLAHMIKGGIFWAYGLVTFARFLGAFSHLGWAWNQAPGRVPVSFEFVESAVIFMYGISNTWMERFGAKAGDPYTTKQIQHISIAVMFWFAGLVGMGLESKTVRKWLASSTIHAMRQRSASLSGEAVAEPPSYIASFNPFPALVIGVTGAAMAAHFQTYVFQVQIHQLWGNLLLGFSVLRCLTYFFLWLGPPRSILPSRPPTEALGSFFLACGGLVFMFSTEELTIAAMRRGRDDVMMFLNVAVAITCFAFCWTILAVGFHGWLRAHVHKGVSYHSTP